MAYIRAFTHEALLPFQYAIFPTILSLLLSSLSWNNDGLMSVIKFFVFLRVIHNEDSHMGRMYLRFIFIKLLVAISLYYVCDKIAFFLGERFLPPGMTSAISATVTRIRLPKSRVPLLGKDYSNILLRGAILVSRILVEYFLLCRLIAQFRWLFLAIVFVVYGTFHVIIWFTLPGKRKSDAGYDDDE